MHILLIHQAFAAINEPGGTRHHEMARALTKLGHKVTVIASPISYLTGNTTTSEKMIVDDLGVTIYRTFTYHALHKSFFHRLISFFSFMFSSFFRATRVKNVDLVWGTSPPIFQGITAWLIARLKGVPFLFEVRDLWPAFAIAVGVLQNKPIIALSQWLEKFLYKHADMVVVNSPGYIEHVSQRGAKDVQLVPNGVDTAMFDPSADGSTFREKHGLQNKFIVMYSGAHGMSNDLPIMVEAADLVKNEEDIHFVFIGDGKEKASLIALAEQKGLQNVLFLPPVEKLEMGQALAAANCCVAILKAIDMYKTTYPNKVFDYMAAGRAVVLAIDGVIREVVESADCGIFAEPGNAQPLADAILELYRSPKHCAALGKHGRVYVEKNFDRLQTAKQLLKLFEALEKKHG